MSLTKLVTRLSLFHPTPLLQSQENVFGGALSLIHTSALVQRSRQGGMYKMDYIVKRERPIGPHKKLAPGVRYDGRVGPMENYRYRVKYPEVSLHSRSRCFLTNSDTFFNVGRQLYY